MPKSLQYKTGSLIYARGDEANRVFVLQSGKVSLISLDLETEEEIRDLVQPGEFFGVKSALGHFPREENAVVLTDSTAMAFAVPEFESFAMSNTKIIFKMLKVFSNQMRRVHTQISRLTEKEAVKPDEGLFSLGEKYLKLKRYAHAKHVFSRYLACYPTGAKSAIAAKNLQFLERTPGSTAGKSSQPKGAAKDYHDAVKLITGKKYREAIEAFTEIIYEGKEMEWVAKSEYEIGHCLFLLGRYVDCIKHFSKILSKNPNHPDIQEVLFYMGEASEKTGDKVQAAIWYNKLLSLPGQESDGMKARAKQALKEMGA